MRINHRRNIPGRTGAQHGFMLIGALAAMAVCTILISALLSITMSATRIEDMGRTRERQIRAAEGGIETAINHLRNSETEAGLGPGGPSDLLACDPVDELIEIDDVPVRVDCVNQGLHNQNGIPILADDGRVALRLLDKSYEGDFVSTDEYPGNARGMDWTGALGTNYTAAGLSGLDAQLLHTGWAPLRVIGGVEVPRQIAAVRHQTAGVPAQSPALEITGFAHQGGPGLWPGATSGAANGCGVASPDNVWTGVVSAVVSATTNWDPSVNGFYCGDTALRNDPGDALLPGTSDWTAADLRITRRAFTSTDCNHPSNGRTPNGVMYLDGSSTYDAAATRILNDWFTGGCPGTTFYVGTGDLYFDVYDPSAPADLRTTLRFDDPTSNWVFGAPIGWDPANERPDPLDFPDVCDRNQPGVNIVLSSRTSIQHSSGRVAICGPRPPLTSANRDQPVHGTAIWQRNSEPLGLRLLPTIWDPANAGWNMNTSGSTRVGVLRLRGGESRASEASEASVRRTQRTSRGLDFPAWPWDCEVQGGCGVWTESFRVQAFQPPTGLGANPGAAAIVDNVFLDVTGNSVWANGTGSGISFNVALAGGGSCTQSYSNLPDNFITTSYDLMDAARGNCRSAINNRTQLVNADITTTVRFNNPPCSLNTAWCGLGTGWFGSGPSESSVEIDAITLRTGWSPYINTSNIGNGTGAGFIAYTNPARATVPNGSFAHAIQRCNGTNYVVVNICTGQQVFNSSLRFPLEDPGLLDGFLPLTSLSVVMAFQHVAADYTGAGGTISVWPAGQPTTEPPACNISITRAEITATSFANPLTKELVTGRDAGPCGSVLRTPDDLVGATMELRLLASNQNWLPAEYGYRVDSVSMQATTEGYDKPSTPFRVRWSPHTDAYSAGDATFHVTGSTSLPTNDVEVDWDGNGRPVGRPMFVGGNGNPGLVAGALGSRANDNWPAVVEVDRLPDPLVSNGAVRPSTRRVLLTACVVDRSERAVSDHRLIRRVQAEVDIIDGTPGGALDAGREVQVRRWRVLHGETGHTGANASTAACASS